jgi:tetratricopeptide (TPR) repeat protein
MILSQQPASGGVSRLCAEARQCADRNDYAQALQLLQRARGLEPQNDKVLLELGRVSALSYDFAAAEKYFADAVQFSGGRVEVHLTAGHHWMDVRRFEAAAREFEHALKVSPSSITAMMRLVEMYSRLRRLDDAAEMAQRAMRENPENEGVLLTWARVLRERKELVEAEKLLRVVFARSEISTDARAAAGYELAAVLDAQGHYDDAMAVLLETKAFLRATATPMLKTLLIKQARIAELTRSFDSKTVERWRANGRSELQPERRLAVLCGYPRSGTTLLEYVVDAHPDVLSADEISVFQSKIYFALSPNLSPGSSYLKAIDSMTNRSLRQLRNDYWRGMESFAGQPAGNRLLLDKNPSLTYDVPALTRVFPESKFLVALRDPRDVCLSCFMQAWPVLPDTIPWLSPEGTIENYVALMGLWLAARPALGASALEVRYEDLISDLAGSARKTLAFLGLTWDEKVLQFNQNAEKKVVRSPTYVEVAKPVYKTAMGRWRNYQKYFEPHYARLEPLLKAFGYAAVIFLCALRYAACVVIVWMLVGLSAGRVSASDTVHRKPGPRRAANSLRRQANQFDVRMRRNTDLAAFA